MSGTALYGMLMAVSGFGGLIAGFWFGYMVGFDCGCIEPKYKDGGVPTAREGKSRMAAAAAALVRGIRWPGFRPHLRSRPVVG